MVLSMIPHIIITRVNLHMRLDPHKYRITRLWEVDGWNRDRIDLLNQWARRSLAKQTNQNFHYITLWQAGHRDPDGALPNEIQIEIENTGTPDDDPLDYKALWNGTPGKKTLNFSGQIVRKVSERFAPPWVITTLDCDDALHKDYVQVISEQEKSEPIIFDMHSRYQYNVLTGAKGVKSTRRPSPLMSRYETEPEYLPVIYNHSLIPEPFKIRKLTKLKGLQTINDTNMFCKGTGKHAEYDLNDYI